MSCSIGDCTSPAKARGWCNRHYLRWFHHGDPLTVLQIKGDDQTRFWSKVNNASPDACWEWTDDAAADKDGYGSVWFRGTQQRAPRVAWMLTHGPIPEGQMVRHRCDNPPCVNPAHLELGTSQENDQDRVDRERSARGIKNGGGAVLDEDAVRTIRVEVSEGATHRTVAARHGVSKTTVSSIIAGRLWGWVR